jgi:serine protease
VVALRSPVTGVLTASPPPPEAAINPSFFDVPQPFTARGGSKQPVTGELVDCGPDGPGPCPNATGKVCLFELRSFSFCDKVLACIEGGGIGAIFFNSDVAGYCTPLRMNIVRSGSVQCSDSRMPDLSWRRNASEHVPYAAPRPALPPLQGYCPLPKDILPTVLGITSGQGAALRAQLAAGQQVTVSMRPPVIPPQTRIGLGIFSGTSMATPHASGVIGVVWSAHTECTGEEIRAALEATAVLPPDAPVGVNRTDKTGYGLIQARAMHDYLVANPCKARSMNASIVLGPQNTTAQAPGSTISVTVIVREAAVPYVPLAGLALELITEPLVQCKRTVLTTDTHGRATTRCTLSRETGRTELTAAIQGVGGMPGVNVTRGIVIR